MALGDGRFRVLPPRVTRSVLCNAASEALSATLKVLTETRNFSLFFPEKGLVTREQLLSSGVTAAEHASLTVGDKREQDLSTRKAQAEARGTRRPLCGLWSSPR